MKSVVSWVYAIIAVLIVALILLLIFWDYVNNFLYNAISMIVDFLTLPV